MSDIHIIFDTPQLIRRYAPSSSVVLLGYANDGPMGKAVYIDSYERAVSIFGEGDLAKAWFTANEAGGINIYLMRLNGSPAYEILSYADGEALKIYSKNAGTKYNDVLTIKTVASTTDPTKTAAVVLTNFDGSQKVYYASRYPTVGQLCEIINIDSDCGLVDFTAEQLTLVPAPTYSLVPGVVLKLSNGVDFEEDLALVDSLRWAYEEPLCDFDCAAVVPIGATYGGNINYIKDLALFCYEKNCGGCTVIGVIDARAKGSDEAVNDYISSLTSTTLDLYNDDHAPYVMVTVGEAQLHDGTGVFTTQLASAVGGLLTNLAKNYSVNNKSLLPTGTLNYEFTSDQQTTLMDKGFNPAKVSVRKNIVLGSALTMAPSTSNFASLTNLRIAQAITEEIINELGEAIGNPDTAMTSAMMKYRIEKVMNEFKSQEYIKAYEYRFTDYQTLRVVEIDFNPVGEIKTIKVSINL